MGRFEGSSYSHSHSQSNSHFQSGSSYSTGSTSQGLGLEDEISLAGGEGGKEKKDKPRIGRLVRPLTREREKTKERHLGGSNINNHEEDNDATPSGPAFGRNESLGSNSNSNSGHRGSEVELSLDTNFDQIDDIVNPIAAAARLGNTSNPSSLDAGMGVGPKNEPYSNDFGNRNGIQSRPSVANGTLNSKSSFPGTSNTTSSFSGNRNRSSSNSFIRGFSSEKLPTLSSFSSNSTSSSTNPQAQNHSARFPSLSASSSSSNFPSSSTSHSASFSQSGRGHHVPISPSSPATASFSHPHPTIAPSPEGRHRPAQINIAKPGLRRITLAEAQQHMANSRGGSVAGAYSQRHASSLGSGPDPTFQPTSDPERTARQSKASKGSSSGFTPDLRGEPSSSSMSEWERAANKDRGRLSISEELNLRKASIVSASGFSERSSTSGISPKTSVSQLPMGLFNSNDSSQDTPPSTGWNRPINSSNDSYSFPPTATNPSTQGLVGVATGLLSPRKSSASSASGQGAGGIGGASSSWMAPDSWAVQPNRLGGALGDEDDESESDQDDENASHTSPRERDRRGSSSGTGMSGYQSGGLGGRSGSTDPFPRGGGTLIDSRRGTAESLGHSSNENNSTNGFTSVLGVGSISGIPTSPKPASIEILDVNDGQEITTTSPTVSLSGGSTGPSPSTPSFIRPSSRGGSALAVAGGAAAAAAGKLGLHRTNKQKIGPRPNTAGSIGGSSNKKSNSNLANVEDDTASIREGGFRDGLSSHAQSVGNGKRPGTGGGAGKNVSNSFNHGRDSQRLTESFSFWLFRISTAFESGERMDLSLRSLVLCSQRLRRSDLFSTERV